MMWRWSRGRLDGDGALGHRLTLANVRLASDAELLKTRNESGPASNPHVWCEAELTRRAHWRSGLPSWAAVAISLVALLLSLIEWVRG